MEITWCLLLLCFSSVSFCLVFTGLTNIPVLLKVNGCCLSTWLNFQIIKFHSKNYFCCQHYFCHTYFYIDICSIHAWKYDNIHLVLSLCHHVTWHFHQGSGFFVHCHTSDLILYNFWSACCSCLQHDQVRRKGRQWKSTENFQGRNHSAASPYFSQLHFGLVPFPCHSHFVHDLESFPFRPNHLELCRCDAYSLHSTTNYLYFFCHQKTCHKIIVTCWVSQIMQWDSCLTDNELHCGVHWNWISFGICPLNKHHSLFFHMPLSPCVSTSERIKEQQQLLCLVVAMLVTSSSCPMSSYLTFVFSTNPSHRCHHKLHHGGLCLWITSVRPEIRTIHNTPCALALISHVYLSGGL